MNSDHIAVAAGVVLCIILSVAGVYCMLGLVKGEATERVRKQQESQAFGPFDDANADLVGLPRKPAPRRVPTP